MKKYHYIYKTTNLVNGKFYIGVHSSNVLEDGYLGSGTEISKAIKELGRDKFLRKIISLHISREDALDLEKLLVNQELVSSPLCYNNILGGRRTNEEVSEAKRKQMSKSHTGKTLSEKHRNSIGAGNRGKKHRPELKEARSAISKRLWEDEDYRQKVISNRKSKKWSEASKSRQSALYKKKWKDPDYRESQGDKLHKNRKPLTMEHKLKISEGNKGKHKEPPSLETRKKISTTLLGRTLTEATKKKMSEASKGKSKNPESVAKGIATRAANRALLIVAP